MKEIICKEEIGGGLFMHTIYEPIQELIRCKDCKFQVNRGRQYPECDKHFLWAKDDWFCADGEKKEGR